MEGPVCPFPARGRALALTLAASVCLAGLALGCEGRYRCNQGRDGGTDCVELCQRYCHKVRMCGVDAGSDCEPSCRDRTESGGQTSNFSCVIEESCDDGVHCSI
jgi:hypothetical protein